MIRPSVNFGAVVYHSMLSQEQADALERQQVAALQNIFGFEMSANKMRKNLA